MPYLLERFSLKVAENRMGEQTGYYFQYVEYISSISEEIRRTIIIIMMNMNNHYHNDEYE